MMKWLDQAHKNCGLRLVLNVALFLKGLQKNSDAHSKLALLTFNAETLTTCPQAARENV